MVSQSKENQNKDNTMKDVEMKNIESPVSKDALSNSESLSGKASVTANDPDLRVLEEIKEHANCIGKFAATKEPRFMLRVIRSLVSIRKKINSKILRRLINGYYPTNSSQKDTLLSYLEEPMDVDSSAVTLFKGRTGKAAQTPLLMELDVYFHLLLLLHLIDCNKLDMVCLDHNNSFPFL